MEEKRKDTGNPPAGSSAAAGTPQKPAEVAPAAEAPSSRRRGGGQKRKAGSGGGGNASTPPTSSSKRQAREKPSVAASHAPIHNGPCTRARQTPSGAAGVGSSSVGASFGAAMKNEKEGMVTLESGGGEKAKAGEETGMVEEDWEALEEKIEAEYEAIRSRDVNAHVVPAPAGWFSWTKVHPLEERALPSFFNGRSKDRTPEMYKEIRNWIMRKFHANPSILIELKDLSELSVGELDARQEVMEFLDYWGLINYHPFPENDTAMVSSDGDGASKTDSLVEKLYCFEAEQSCVPVVPKNSVTTPAVPSGLFPESAIAEELMRPEGPSVEYHCNSCSADCSRKRYHCQKQADFDLCSECFNNGKFDSDMSPMDFILMEPAEAAGVSGGKWTDQETLLLLEALELYKENWNEIAEHVATKTKAQCILHFVQMPIEDTFMDCDEETDAGLKENGDHAKATSDSSTPKDATERTEGEGAANENHPQSSPMKISMPEDSNELKVGQEINENFALKALKDAFEAVGSFPTPGNQFSFADAGNPVMALAAFLVRLVEPNVVTAMACKSTKSIYSNSFSMQLAARHCFLLEDPPDDKKSADSDRAATETVEQDTQKNEKENEIKQKEEKSNSVLNDGGLPNDHNNEKDQDSIREKKELSGSPVECVEKSHTVNDTDVIGTHEKGQFHSLNESENPDMPKDQATRDAKESDCLASGSEICPSSLKDPGDRTPDVIRIHDEGSLVSLTESDKPDLPNHPSRAGKESDVLIPEKEAPSNFDKVPGAGASDEVPSQCTDSAKDAVAVPDSLPSDKGEPEEPITSNPIPITENGRNTGEEETKDCHNSENEAFPKTKDDHNIYKLKRAAVTALSAAAVKAKLLADQEEDQIRQLATLLIDRQLHKLEAKLMFFTEMESLVMRVREQMERSKQRLYQERAQIIASRLGAFPASSSRPMQQSLLINRAAMGFANSALRPLMSIPSQRPPMSRSMMTSIPTTNPFVPATASGNPVRPTNQDKISSVVTK
ncbi:SWI/SNF complex subunit SWI3D [Diospyros lotus]|uniref:SWI/SNF complex subunit SWI3D n=1 Tax=Diospyros lotus TaxID=55363 RepID=UPI002256D2B2|nr:SWI/SNF complex subunit SWI3D [Diospyros lotus]